MPTRQHTWRQPRRVVLSAPSSRAAGVSHLQAIGPPSCDRGAALSASLVAAPCPRRQPQKALLSRSGRAAATGAAATELLSKVIINLAWTRQQRWRLPRLNRQRAGVALDGRSAAWLYTCCSSTTSASGPAPERAACTLLTVDAQAWLLHQLALSGASMRKQQLAMPGRCASVEYASGPFVCFFSSLHISPNITSSSNAQRMVKN